MLFGIGLVATLGCSGDAPEGDSLESATQQLLASTGKCAEVSEWPPEWEAFEYEVLLRVNEARSQGADCGTRGTFEPTQPLSSDLRLRCSARLHSADMFERGFFSHTNPDGESPFQRMEDVGYRGKCGENIAVGQRTPQEVVEAWLASDAHCANLMHPEFVVLGVGFHLGTGQGGLNSHFWTQNFGAEEPALDAP